AYDALEKSGDRARMAQVARELSVHDLVAGDRAAASRHVQAYSAAGGKNWSAAPPWPSAPTDNQLKQLVYIPGPLHSFGRMAAISNDINQDEVLPAIARNVVTNGYQASHSNDALEQTE